MRVPFCSLSGTAWDAGKDAEGHSQERNRDSGTTITSREVTLGPVPKACVVTFDFHVVENLLYLLGQTAFP